MLCPTVTVKTGVLEAFTAPKEARVFARTQQIGSTPAACLAAGSILFLLQSIQCFWPAPRHRGECSPLNAPPPVWIMNDLLPGFPLAVSLALLNRVLRGGCSFIKHVGPSTGFQAQDRMT